MRKVFLILTIFSLIIGNAYSNEQEQEHKHEQFEMLLGLGVGFGLTPKFYEFLDPKKNDEHYVYFDFGLNFDFYLTNHISVSTGCTIRPKALSSPYLYETYDSPGLKFPVSINIPFAIHLNVPPSDKLYIGAGICFNLPLVELGDKLEIEPYISIPIDIGIDFIRSSRGGRRLMFRLIPEIHDYIRIYSLGVFFQTYNWKLNSE